MATKAQPQNLAIGDIIQWTVIAGAVAAVINAIVFFLADTLGVFEGVVMTIGTTEMTFSVVPVVVSSFVFIGIGGVVLWLIDLFSNQPLMLWRNVAVLALLLSFLQPIFLLDAPMDTVIVLELMHIIAGAIAIFLLTTQLKTA